MDQENDDGKVLLYNERKTDKWVIFFFPCEFIHDKKHLNKSEIK